MNEKCSAIETTYLSELGVNLYKITNLLINNIETTPRHIGGTVYLMPAFVPYGHALMDCYAQLNLIKKYVPEVTPIFYNLSSKGWTLDSYSFKPVMYDLMTEVGSSEVIDLSSGSFTFDEVVLMFDYTNSLSTDFYRSNGVTESTHYPLFCSCYMGTEPCGTSNSFKYNFAALDFLKNAFNHYKCPKENKKLYVSRRGVNEAYSMTIDDLSRKSALTLEEAGALQRAKIRHYADELELEAYFASKGYEIINPDGMGLFEQVTLFSKASHIAGLSGVGLFNMFWAETPTVYEVCVNPGYYYHHQVFGEHTGANYQKIEAYHSDPKLVIATIESVLKQTC
jgi:hypothetical protein